MANLGLDPVKIDTNLAEKYLKDHNNFGDWPQAGKYWHIERYVKDEYCYASETELHSKFEDYMPVYIGRKLAKKIEEKLELFSQLEYTIRKTDAVDVKNNIKLLSQHLTCSSASWNVGNIDRLKLNILVNVNTPLCALGCVAIALYESKVVVKIVTSKEMAPLCSLFTELCREVGWTIPLIYAYDTYEYREHLTRGNDAVVEVNFDFQCIGVITESADIDSALDMFINSSVTAPWKLQRIYIQESVYEEVKAALAWKGTRAPADGCGDAFTVGGTTFVCDELTRARATGVLLEAYRTSKELCAMVSRHQSCLSVWASDSQHSAELALATPAALVWVNDYASFDGPPQASLPLYRALYPVVSSSLPAATRDQLDKVKTAWTKLTENERIDVIFGALKEDKNEKQEVVERVRSYQKAVLGRLEDSFVFTDRGRICYGVRLTSPSEEYKYVRVNRTSDLYDLFKAVVDGVAVAYDIVGMSDKSFEFKYEESLLESLQRAGVPVAKCGGTKEPTLKVKHSILFNAPKVISTTCGTIFAN